MNTLQLIGIGSLLLPGFMTTSIAAELGGTPQSKASHIINQPTIDGYRLDGCNIFGGECNGQAAENYCQTLGFQSSTAYTMSQDSGFDTKTIGSEQICDGSLYMCGAYEQISCSNVWNYQYITSVHPDTDAPITRIEPRFAHEGEHIALLTMDNHDSTTMAKVSQGFDDIYEFYQSNSGYTPWTHINYFGKLSIAEVESRWTMCGPGGYGCGFIGATGIEIISDGLSSSNNGLISLVENDNLWSMTLAYELGRNFMPPSIANKMKFGDQEIGNITTGFAIYMGHTSVEKTGKVITPEQVSVRNDIELIVDIIEQDANLNFANTFLNPQVSINANGRNLGAADMMASVMWHFENKYGAAVYQNFWKEMSAIDAPINSINDAANGFAVAMSLAVGEDVSAEFSSKWGWPELSDSYRALLPTAGCNASWDAQTVYNNGDVVSNKNSYWRAQWWTQGDRPGASIWGPWEFVSGC